MEIRKDTLHHNQVSFIIGKSAVSTVFISVGLGLVWLFTHINSCVKKNTKLN